MDAPWDAVVIGGGPAGCSAAISLAAMGAQVCLLEARTFPHDKLCGEFLSPECAGLLDSLGLTPALRSLQPVAIETACLTAPGGAAWETALPGVALGLSRSALDAALAERAGALGVHVRQGATATEIEGDLRSGFRVRTRGRFGTEAACARLVVAAHGKRGALDRALARRFLRRPQPFVALKAHFQGPPLPGRIELHAFPGGYCGMSEIEGGAANVCFLVRERVFREAARGAPDPAEAFAAWMARQNARLGRWLERARRLDARWIAVGQVPFAAKRPVVRDVLMAGDSAGLIAPLAGDGIAMALRGGQLAAAACADFLAGQLDADGLRRDYARVWRREFGPRLRLARLLQAFMLRPAWLGGALRVVNAFPAFGTFLVRHTREARNPI